MQTGHLCDVVLCLSGGDGAEGDKATDAAVELELVPVIVLESVLAQVAHLEREAR
jgi:hypothetical protein